MTDTEHPPHPHRLPIDDHPTPTRRTPPTISKLPPVDPKSLANSTSSPSTPKPLQSPLVEKSVADVLAVKKDDEKPKSPAPPPKAELVEEEGPEETEDEIIDMETFQQIIDLDEDGTHEFSRGMAWAYFSQAEQTFKEMEDALKKKDLENLSSLGHFLKGSSAALGLSKVQASCEKIQHHGQLRDEEANKDLTKDEALDHITKLIRQVKKEYITAERWLKDWYTAHPDPE